MPHWLFARFAQRTWCLCTLVLASTLSLGGCGEYGGRKLPPPLEFSVQSPYANVMTLAVAPAINLSGSRDFDPLVVSDILYGELQQVERLNILPLNKTILAMQRLGIRHVNDVATAQQLAAALGADGLVIPAITVYDPYNPPAVGMILQMYTPAQPAPAEVPVPIDDPTGVQSNPDRPLVVTQTMSVLQATALASRDVQPVSQVAGVFNASNQTVLKELAVFAKGRSQYGTALEEQRFIMDSDAYMRFVCHAMVRRLMDVESMRVSDR